MEEKKADLLDAMLGTLEEYYPGSRRKRREPSVAPLKVVSVGSWDSAPQVKKLPNGKVVELFSMGSLGVALRNRPLVTLRLWERKGYIPKAPYRLRSMIVDGIKKPGWRMYSRAMIESAIESFQSRGLLDSARIDWNQHLDLSIEILENWKRIHNQETN